LKQLYSILGTNAGDWWEAFLGWIDPYNGRRARKAAHGYAGNGDINSRSRYGAQIRLSALYASICYVNSGLIGVSIIIKQNFLSASVLDLLMLVSVLSFAVGIPLLAYFVLFLQRQLDHGFVLSSGLQRSIVYLQLLGLVITIIGFTAAQTQPQEQK